MRSLHFKKRSEHKKIGFSWQLKPNNILIKQSPNAHIPSLAGKSCIWANEEQPSAHLPSARERFKNERTRHCFLRSQRLITQ